MQPNLEFEVRQLKKLVDGLQKNLLTQIEINDGLIDRVNQLEWKVKSLETAVAPNEWDE